MNIKPQTLSPVISLSTQTPNKNSINQEEIQNWLLSTLSKELILDEEIDIHEPLAQYGLSSMTAVGLAGDLEDWLDIQLPATLAWDYPTIDAISKFIFNEIN
ncbi:MAG: acyl carrier protein [Thermosynechococcaceae cyanobacterium]